MTGPSGLRRRALALLVLAVLAAPAAPAAPGATAPAGAQPAESARGRLQLGLQAGMVIDPAPWGIEQVHAAAGALLGWRDGSGSRALSLRPTLLYNSGGALLRLPVVLRVGLGGGSRAGPCRYGLILGAGAGTWTGDAPRLHALLGAGGELCVGPLWLSAGVTAVLMESSVDLLGDLLLSCVWEPPGRSPL